MSFELLNSSLPLSVPKLHACKATCDPVVLAQASPIPSGHQSVNVAAAYSNYYKCDIDSSAAFFQYCLGYLH